MTLGVIRLETQAQSIQYFSGALDESEKRFGIRGRQAKFVKCKSRVDSDELILKPNVLSEQELQILGTAVR